MIKVRELWLIIPEGAREAQLKALQALQEIAAKSDVILKIIPYGGQ